MLMAMLRAAVEAHPAKPAIVCGDERISWRELAARVARCAGGLRALGVGPGFLIDEPEGLEGLNTGLMMLQATALTYRFELA